MGAHAPAAGDFYIRQEAIAGLATTALAKCRGITPLIPRAGEKFMKGIRSCADHVARSLNNLRALLVLLTASLALIATFSPALASETITYTYDTLGRLIAVNHGTSGPNAGVSASYTYDKADNRAQVVVNADGGGATTITLSPTSLPNGTVGTVYPSTTITASGGTSPYTYAVTSGALPAGLALSSGGVLSGTPSAAGTSTFTVTGTDSASHTGSQSYLVTVSAVTIILSPATVPNGTVGTAYNSTTITASGGTSPYTYAVSSGTLPAGLTLSSGGVLSGTPTTAASYSFTVKATDSASHTGTRSYSVTVSPSNTLTLSPTTLPNGTAGTAYSQTITASGGTSPYTFTKSSGTLPAGLALSSNGVLSGTPTTAATSSFTIKATDSAGNHIGSRSYSVTVASSTGTCSGISFSVNSVEVMEGDPLTFTVTKTGSTSSSCSVDYATADGTARAGTNYVAASGTLTFTSTQTSGTVTITTMGGHIVDGKHATMSLNLSNPTAGGGISDSSGIGTLDSDGSICTVCGIATGPDTSATTADPGTAPTTTTDQQPPGQ